MRNNFKKMYKKEVEQTGIEQRIVEQNKMDQNQENSKVYYATLIVSVYFNFFQLNKLMCLKICSNLSMFSETKN